MSRGLLIEATSCFPSLDKTSHPLVIGGLVMGRLRPSRHLGTRGHPDTPGAAVSHPPDARRCRPISARRFRRPGGDELCHPRVPTAGVLDERHRDSVPDAAVPFDQPDAHGRKEWDKHVRVGSGPSFDGQASQVGDQQVQKEFAVILVTMLAHRDLGWSAGRGQKLDDLLSCQRNRSIGSLGRSRGGRHFISSQRNPRSI